MLLVAATLVVRQRFVDAAWGVLDSRQNIQTTTNNVASRALVQPKGKK